MFWVFSLFVCFSSHGKISGDLGSAWFVVAFG